MKKILSFISLVLCALLCSAFIAACGSNSKWLTPEFTFEGEGLSVEFVSNREKDFEFPIEGLKFEHSQFADSEIFQYGWVIYNADRELVGWIETGSGYETDNKGNIKYGFSPMTSNGVFGYPDTIVTLIVEDTDLTVFDGLEIKADCCSVTKATGFDNPVKGSDRFTSYDEQTNSTKPSKGSENFVCCSYMLKISEVDPDGPETIKITFSLKKN